MLYVVVILVMLVGYGTYQQFRERQLAARLKKMRDAGTIGAEIDAAIQQTNQEAEFFKRNSGRRL